ncbi:hypothetical protein V6C20_01190 [Caldibacillus thermoamylovorans]
MRNFKRDLLAEYIEKDERIRKLYNQIKDHPNHKRKLIVEESLNNKKGKITYSKRKVTIEMNITLGCESILILAHELMHYLLILDGALLPVEKVSNKEAESLIYILMRSITHHFLLKQKLDALGFEDLQKKYSLSDEPQEKPNSYYFDEITWLLELYDNSTLAKNYNFDSLREKFEQQQKSCIFDFLQNAPKKTIQDINEISECLIKSFKLEDSIELVDLECYTSQK